MNPTIAGCNWLAGSGYWRVESAEDTAIQQAFDSVSKRIQWTQK